MSKEHKYNSLEEVLVAIDECEWDDNPENIEDTEENRQMLEECLFWCGIELMRFTYKKEPLYECVKWLKSIRSAWDGKEGR